MTQNADDILHLSHYYDRYPFCPLSYNSFNKYQMTPSPNNMILEDLEERRKFWRSPVLVGLLIGLVLVFSLSYRQIGWQKDPAETTTTTPRQPAQTGPICAGKTGPASPPRPRILHPSLPCRWFPCIAGSACIRPGRFATSCGPMSPTL